MFYNWFCIVLDPDTYSTGTRYCRYRTGNGFVFSCLLILIHTRNTDPDPGTYLV